MLLLLPFLKFITTELVGLSQPGSAVFFNGQNFEYKDKKEASPENSKFEFVKTKGDSGFIKIGGKFVAHMPEQGKQSLVPRKSQEEAVEWKQQEKDGVSVFSAKTADGKKVALEGVWNKGKIFLSDYEDKDSMKWRAVKGEGGGEGGKEEEGKEGEKGEKGGEKEEEGKKGEEGKKAEAGKKDEEKKPEADKK